MPAPAEDGADPDQPAEQTAYLAPSDDTGPSGTPADEGSLGESDTTGAQQVDEGYTPGPDGTLGVETAGPDEQDAGLVQPGFETGVEATAQVEEALAQVDQSSGGVNPMSPPARSSATAALLAVLVGVGAGVGGRFVRPRRR